MDTALFQLNTIIIVVEVDINKFYVIISLSKNVLFCSNCLKRLCPLKLPRELMRKDLVCPLKVNEILLLRFHLFLPWCSFMFYIFEITASPLLDFAEQCYIFVFKFSPKIPEDWYRLTKFRRRLLEMQTQFNSDEACCVWKKQRVF